jgi:hypothetical protein
MNGNTKHNKELANWDDLTLTPACPHHPRFTMSDNELDMSPIGWRRYVVDESDGTYKLVPYGEENKSSDEMGMRKNGQSAEEVLVYLLDSLEPTKNVLIGGRQTSVRGSIGYRRVTYVDFHTDEPQWIW